MSKIEHNNQDLLSIDSFLIDQDETANKLVN
jgi:hypothetical protein